MKSKEQDFRDKRVEKLKVENETMRKRLAALTKENQELRRNLEDRKSLFDVLPGGILVIQQEKIIHINKTALDLIGYKAEEVLGRHFLNFVHPKNRAFFRNLYKHRAAGKSAPRHCEAAFVAKGGEILGCDVRVRKMRLNGRIAYLARITRLDERKKRERDLTQSKKMEALITMASGLTNRLGPAVETILNGIRSFKDVKGPGCQDITGGVSELEDAANLIMDTTRSLRSLSKTHQAKSEETLFDLKKVVKEAIGLSSSRIKEEAERRDVKIDLKTYLRSVSAVEGNPLEIRNVIVQLIVNAVEAMPRGGVLYLSTEENAGYAHIYIQDSGVGIPEDLEDRILDPFFSTKADQGNGLGLSLSSAAIRRHHGTIEVTSKKDQGTTVTIRLPLARAEPKQKDRGVKRKARDAQILLVGDDNMVMQILSQLLVSKGYRVVSAVSAREGLNHLRKKPCHMVIVGSEMPDMKAEALAERIRTQDKTIPLAVIAEHEGMVKDGHAGIPDVDLLITKPIDMNDLVSRIWDLLLGGRLK